MSVRAAAVAMAFALVYAVPALAADDSKVQAAPQHVESGA